jgi:hypothetical protein
MAKSKTTLLSDAFIQNNENISEDEAAAKVIQISLDIQKLKDIRKNDDKLKAGKEFVKNIADGYKSAINAEKEKVKFLLSKIQEIQDNRVNPSNGLGE